MAVSKDDLIFDRTIQDIYDAYNSANNFEDKKGCYNVSDMNRICEIIDKIVEKINETTSYNIEKLNKSYNVLSAMTQLEFNEVLNKYNLIVRHYNTITSGIKQQIRTDGIFTYREANLLEKTLYEICVSFNIN